MNRQGFFTIRGIKDGVGETDILALKRSPQRMKALAILS